MNEKELESLIQTTRVFRKDIGMKFGFEKYSMLVVKRGKMIKSNVIKLPDDIVMTQLKEGEGYKYLGALQADEVQEKEIKRKVDSDHKRRARKIREIKLNVREGNIIKGIST